MTTPHITHTLTLTELPAQIITEYAGVGDVCIPGYVLDHLAITFSPTAGAESLTLIEVGQAGSDHYTFGDADIEPEGDVYMWRLGRAPNALLRASRSALARKVTKWHAWGDHAELRAEIIDLAAPPPHGLPIGRRAALLHAIEGATEVQDLRRRLELLRRA